MKSDRVTIIIEKGKKRIIAQSPIHGVNRLVFVINHQFTNAPNTTQLASGAGRSSASGSNAAIKSPHSQQQQSVGAGGKAWNRILKGGAKGGLHDNKQLTDIRRKGKEIVVVINDQIVKLPKHAKNASATQVASGAGKYSTSGTNSAIDSPGTKQQDAVGGNGKASNTLSSKKRKRKVEKRS